MIDLSIVIVNWNTRDLLRQCLQSVCDTVQGLEFEVFVTDNTSSDGGGQMGRDLRAGTVDLPGTTSSLFWT